MSTGAVSAPRRLPRLRSLSDRFHRLLNRSQTGTLAYLWLWRVLLRWKNSGGFKTRVVENLARFPWDVPRLSPASIQLAGSSALLRVVPHPGMLDFRAAFLRDYEYEPETVSFVAQRLAQFDNVVEIGANIGLYTVLFAHSLRGRGRVFTFEPGLTAYRALLDNLQANAADNVTAFNAAVFDHTGIETFYESIVTEHGYRDSTRSSLVERHARWQTPQVREYPVLTVGPDLLERFFKDGGRVLVKMDIEGAERLVLRALEPLLTRYRPNIVMEALINDCAELNRIEYIPKLYRLFHLTEQGPVEHPHFVGDPTYRCKDYFLSPRE